MKKRILALAISVCMVLSMTSPVFAAEEPIQSGMGTIIVDSSSIYFAGEEWYVIGYNGTGVAPANGTATLLKRWGWEPAKRTSQFNPLGGENNYKNSSLQTAMTNFYSAIDAKEQALIIPRDLGTDGIAGDEVNGQYLWPLSTDEANAISNNSVREYFSSWWLRSPGILTVDAAFVRNFGVVYSGGNDVDNYYGVRPAFKLNLDSVLFTSAAVGGKSGAESATLSAAKQPAGALKLTVKDSGHTLTTATTDDELTANAEITVSYTGATTGAALSAVVTDKATGAVNDYGTLVASVGAADGTTKVNLPAAFDSAIMELKLFTETKNGDKKTDYASELVTVTKTVAAKPTVTGVTPTGTGAALSGNVEITFNEAMDISTAGTVQLNSLGALAAGTWNTGNTVYTVGYSGLSNSTEYTVNISGFKSAAGTIMDADSTHTFTTVAPNTPVITASPSSVSFGEVTVNTTAAAITVTIGGSNLTVPITYTIIGTNAANFTVTEDSGYSDTTGGKLNITFNPTTAGNHTAALELTSTGATPVTVNLSGVGKSSGNNNNNGGGSYEPSYYSRTLTDPKTGITVSGSQIHESASLTIKPYTLGNETGTEFDRLRELKAQGHILLSYDISLSHAFKGEITITFPVDKAYNGKKIMIVHLENGKPVVHTTTVENGKANIKETSLSPFMLFDGVYPLGQEAHKNPQTGVGFDDVNPTDWFYDSVMSSVEKGWFSGVSDTLFAPNSPLTRAMLVTVLHRMEGTPVAKAPAFSDVLAGQWYTNAIGWAQEESIVSGYGNGLFGTNDSITREQLAVILYRYAKAKGIDVSKTTALSSFADSKDIFAYATEAMSWAVAEGVIAGRTSTLLAPKGTATRAEAATMLLRFDELTAKIK